MLAKLLSTLPIAAALLAQTAPEPASVAGMVTNSVTGEPVVRAHVTVGCFSSDPQKGSQNFGALTNAKGEFSITTLPAANCMVSAQRVGFVSGVRQENVSLSPGTHKEALKLKLVPAGVISGRVMSSAGEPCPGVGVSAGLFAEGFYAANMTTDDQGQFRLGGLRPGRYRVKAVKDSMPFPPEIRSDGSVEMYDAATYYPNSLNARTAQWVDVKPAAEVSGIEIRLVKTPVVKVSGKVTGVAAGAKNVMVNLTPNGKGAGVTPDGTFTIWRVDPGKYRLQAAQWSGQTSLRSATVEIEVNTANVENLELPLIAPFEIAGQLRFDDEQARQPLKPPGVDGAAPKGPPPQPPRVELEPVLQNFGQAFGSLFSADDSFTLENVLPGRYRVQTSGMSGYVKSIRAGDTETEGSILDLNNGSRGPVTVTVSSNFAEISGVVSDFKGPSADVRLALVQVPDGLNYQTSRSDSSGSYRFRTAPGKYKVIVMGDDDTFMGFQPGELSELEGESVEVSAGDKLRKDLVRKE